MLISLAGALPGYPCGSERNESACNAEDACSIPGSERSPGEGMATHSSILAWRIHEQRSRVGSLSRVLLFVTPRTDSNLPGSSIHGIFQARLLEGVDISFSKGSSQPRD